MALARSYLFVPADRPERYAKAIASGADAVVVDLEDAVAPAAKDAARAMLLAELARHSWPNVIVRINAADTTWHDDDVRALAGLPLAGIMLPKAADPAVLRSMGSRVPLLPIIESAAGIVQMRGVAGCPGVARLVFGSLDLQVDLGMHCDAEESELLPLRLDMVIASRLASLPPPVDGVSTALDQPDALQLAVRGARRMGFGAKLCIHPRQVEVVNQGFLPGPHEVAWASAVLTAFAASGGGAVAVDGKMVDQPVLLQARRILAQRGGA